MLLTVTDLELVGQTRGGNTQAFGELVRRHHLTLYRFALRIVRSPADAEDVTQSAWLQAYRHVAGFHGDASVRTWLVAIVRNHALDHQRAARRRLRQDAGDLDQAELQGACVSRLPSPEDLLLFNEHRAHLTQAIHKLPGKLRDALRLWHSGRYSYAEMAAQRDVAIGTMKSRVCLARRHITRAFPPVMSLRG
jgi:RNA polymerase sigma-70 factor (ECF subfamily)